MFVQVYRHEGVSAFFAGLPAAMLRQATYGGLSFAAYPYIRDSLQQINSNVGGKAGSEEAALWTKLLAGGIAGGGAAALANPSDVIKVRMQSDGRLQLLGKAPRYASLLNAAKIISREEGLRAFYHGLMPNIGRAIVVNGVGIAGYDHTKQTVRKLLGEEQGNNPMTARLAGALIGGISTAVAGCPFDVLKTRMMNQWQHSAVSTETTPSAQQVKAPVSSFNHPKVHPALLHAHTKPLYTSMWHCLQSIVKQEGVLALWKGVLPVYCRQAPFNMLHYMIMEQLTILTLGISL
jgi:hypothetical protein